MPEAEEASTQSVIEKAHEGFLSKFDEVISDVVSEVNQEAKNPAPVEQPKASEEEPKVEEKTEQEKPGRKDQDLEARIAEDPELKDYFTRKLQSTRDKTIAEINKQAKREQLSTDISSKNPAFAEDWSALSAEAKSAWISSQPEFGELSGEVAKAIAADLLDLLGSDPETLTSEMLAPDGRDLLREHLLSSKAFVAKLEKIKKEAYEAGQSDARATDRGTTGRPLSGTASPRSAPTTLAEAGTALMEGLSKLGL